MTNPNARTWILCRICGDTFALDSERLHDLLYRHESKHPSKGVSLVKVSPTRWEQEGLDEVTA